MNNFFAPAHPTHPIQDKFGQVLVNFGMNKLEYLAGMIAANLANFSEKYLPETIAEEAVKLAMAVLEATNEELKKEITTSKKLVDGSAGN